MARKPKTVSEDISEEATSDNEANLLISEEELEGSGLRELVDKGKEQGFITYEDINSMLPDDISDPDQIEETIG